MYESFAYVYDMFMENIPYERWAENIHDLLIENNIKDGLLLDMGCGTAVLAILAAKKKAVYVLVDKQIKKDKPSTVLLISDKIKVVREGKIPSKKLIEESNRL